MGKAGTTKEEAIRKFEVKNEKELQKQILSLLRLKGIEVNYSRMDKPKTDRVGMPDFLFCIINNNPPAYYHRDHEWELTNTYSCAWECKWDKGALSKEQQQMLSRLSTQPNGWRVKIIRSVDAAIAELRLMGIT